MKNVKILEILTKWRLFKKSGGETTLVTVYLELEKL